jgi:agmatinase
MLQFLGHENDYAALDGSTYGILPVPYEGAVSFGKGAAEAPDEVLKASQYLEFYDEVLKREPYSAGISTLAPTPVTRNHAEMHEIIYEHSKEICAANKFPIILGGDHSISSASFRAVKENYSRLSCIQIDAHADLRNAYEGSRYSHASVMARIREMTPDALQLGIRSMSKEEAEWIDADQLSVCTMHDMRQNSRYWIDMLKALPNPVYITFDVDAFNWDVIASTGTPEPGGISWDEAMDILQRIFASKRVVGFDAVELSASPYDRNSPFAVAKLIYKMIGFHQVFNSQS